MKATTTEQQSVNIGRLAHVTITGRGSFYGRIVRETTIGFNIIPDGVVDASEWFAKKSDMVNTVVIKYAPAASEASK